MRISDWSSDVCSSDLGRAHGGGGAGRRRSARRAPGGHYDHPRDRRAAYGDAERRGAPAAGGGDAGRYLGDLLRQDGDADPPRADGPPEERKSVQEGKGVSVRVDTGGPLIIKKKKKKEKYKL